MLKVLDDPDIPLQTNASANELRILITKRRISRGTTSRDGRVARDVMLGLMKTLQRPGLSFYHYSVDWLGPGNIDQPAPPLPTIILARA